MPAATRSAATSRNAAKGTDQALAQRQLAEDVRQGFGAACGDVDPRSGGLQGVPTARRRPPGAQGVAAPAGVCDLPRRAEVSQAANEPLPGGADRSPGHDTAAATGRAVVPARAPRATAPAQPPHRPSPPQGATGRPESAAPTCRRPRVPRRPDGSTPAEGSAPASAGRRDRAGIGGRRGRVGIGGPTRPRRRRRPTGPRRRPSAKGVALGPGGCGRLNPLAARRRGPAGGGEPA